MARYALTLGFVIQPRWGSERGRVFFIDHDGPYHCLAFESLSSLTALPSRNQVSQSIEPFGAGTDDLRSFLEGSPSHYSVHDLRRSRLGSTEFYGGIAKQSSDHLLEAVRSNEITGHLIQNLINIVVSPAKTEVGGACT